MRAAAMMAVLAAAAVSVTGCADVTVVHTTSAKAELHKIQRSRGIVPTTAAPATHSPRPKPTRPPSTHTAAQPPSTPSPVTSDADCPFLATAFVQDTVGQHIARVTTTTSVPTSCAFYRPDGGLAAAIVRRTLATPAAAAQAATHTTGAGANPEPTVGDGGSVSITDSGAVLAASSGAVLIVVRINQQSSLEARELATRSVP